MDEHGDTVHVPLVEQHVLIGGTTGAGKGVAQSMLVAAAALDPAARLTLIDGKEVERAASEPVADCVVGVSVKDAVRALRSVQAELHERMRVVKERGERKIRPTDPLRVVVIDEPALFSTASK